MALWPQANISRKRVDMSAKHDEKIYILDEVTAQPGKAQEFLRLYMAEFAPAARERGMTLEFTWTTPAMWLDDQSNMLFLIWSCKGAPGWSDHAALQQAQSGGARLSGAMRRG